MIVSDKTRGNCAAGRLHNQRPLLFAQRAATGRMPAGQYLITCGAFIQMRESGANVKALVIHGKPVLSKTAVRPCNREVDAAATCCEVGHVSCGRITKSSSGLHGICLASSPKAVGW